MSTADAVTSLLPRPSPPAGEPKPLTPLIFRIVGASFCEGYPTTWMCLNRWSFDGVEAIGEDHDNWGAATARRHFRSLLFSGGE
jgi:hypothetical protein